MLRKLSMLMLLAALLAACGSSGPVGPVDSGYGPSSSGDVAATQPTAAPMARAQLREITIAMSYIPNVQFAPFYVADKNGYYAEADLKVNFDYNFETDVVQRTAQETAQFGLASGDSVLLARSKGLPIVTVATTSQRFPIVVFSKAEANIAKPVDLKGKSLGIPGRFGASYIGLLALLYASKMQESDLNIQEIGFTQAVAVSQGKVQAATGYGNNEPVQLEQQGIKVNTIKVSDYFPLASDGIVTSEKLIKEQPDAVRGFVRATLRGMQDVIADPDAAFATALQYIPEAQRGDTALQRKVLQATLPYWQSDATAKNGLGFTDRAQWDATYTFLRDSGLLKEQVDVGAAFTNAYLK